jgi:hypothetical protein
LSASIGLVYCHHDAPIARIRALADRLAEHVKTVDKKSTRVFPLVLESFDHIGDNLDHYLKQRTPKACAIEASRNQFFVLSKSDLATLQTLASEFAKPDQLSRSRLRALAQAAHDGRMSKEKDAPWVRMLKHSSALVETHKVALAALSENGSEAPYRRAWMLLEEYWDYLNPCDTPSALAEEPEAGKAQ